MQKHIENKYTFFNHKIEKSFSPWALLHSYIMQCLHKSIPETPWLFHSQFHYDAVINIKITNLSHKREDVWLCIWNILGLLE